MKFLIIIVILISTITQAESKFIKWQICVNESCSDIKDGESYKIDDNCYVTSINKSFLSDLKERQINCFKKNVNGDDQSGKVSCDKNKLNKAVLEYSDNVTYTLSCSK